jgi:predicted nucleic acid-binding protein
MNDRAFFDTNVLVYAFDNSEPGKSAIAKKLIHDFGKDGNLALSTQVLQEFYVTLTKVGRSLLTSEDAGEIVNDFAEFPLVQVDKNIISRAMKRHRSKVFSFWDALIVEAALQSGCSQLLSEDMQDGLVIDSLTIRNPFADLSTHPDLV